VVAALVDLVIEQGYAATSMDQVAERAGVSKATIYRRWPSKDALIVDAHRTMVDEAGPPDTGTLEGDLMALQQHAVTLMSDERFARMTQASAGEALANPELAAVFREDVMGSKLDVIRTVFERAEARGELRAGVDWRAWAYALIGSTVFRVVFMGEQPDREANAQLVRAIVRDSLVAPRLED